MYYKPENGVLADVIPYYENGKFYLYYLRDYRNKEACGEGVPWVLLTTDDFVHFEDFGEVVPRGKENEQDLYIFTGSVIKGNDEKYYIFYTGHNPHYINMGKPQEVIMLAVSDDKVHWEKQNGFDLGAPDGYEKDDFRDPFVFFDESIGQYRMILAARKAEGEFYRRGCLLSYTSCDLTNWTIAEKPFYEPEAFYMHECPDYFKMGDWYYLLFSEFNDKFCTHYRMSKSPCGPWLTPEFDTFDNRSFYAAKTAADKAGRRYLFGWNPTREEERDYSMWQWGGNLVVHEICQRADGTLYVRQPDSVKAAFGVGKEKPVTAINRWAEKQGDTFVMNGQGFGSVLFDEVPKQGMLSCKFRYQGGGDFGIRLRVSEDYKHAYSVKIDPRNNRLCFDRTERPQADMQFMVESERSVIVEKGKEYELTVCLDGEIAEIYLDGQTAMSVRMYDFIGGKWGLYGNFADIIFSIVKKSDR